MTGAAVAIALMLALTLAGISFGGERQGLSFEQLMAGDPAAAAPVSNHLFMPQDGAAKALHRLSGTIRIPQHAMRTIPAKLEPAEEAVEDMAAILASHLASAMEEAPSAIKRVARAADEVTPLLDRMHEMTWDHVHETPLEFMEVREGDAIYYIAQVSFINEQWRWYEIDFRPEGATKTYTHKFRHQLYVN